MITQLAHIGIAVEDLDQATQVFVNAMGGRLVEKTHIPEMNLHIALISLGGINLELLHATGEGPIATFIKKRGSGIHHLAFEVTDIEEALSICQQQGLQLIDRTPRRGATARKIAFLHPHSTGNVLIELCEH